MPRIGYPPRAFDSVQHLLTARKANPAIVHARRNLALNPLDQHGSTGMLAVIQKHTDVILAFKDLLAASNGKTETGANLVWKCHVLLLTGILRRDMTWIHWVNRQLPSVLQFSSFQNTAAAAGAG